jgi:hypothetical protein
MDDGGRKHGTFDPLEPLRTRRFSPVCVAVWSGKSSDTANAVLLPFITTLTFIQQVLPMFLVVLPLVNMITAFKNYGLARPKNSRRQGDKDR